MYNDMGLKMVPDKSQAAAVAMIPLYSIVWFRMTSTPVDSLIQCYRITNAYITIVAAECISILLTPSLSHHYPLLQLQGSTYNLKGYE